MQKYLWGIIVGVGSIAGIYSVLNSKPVVANTEEYRAVFDSQGNLQLPTGYRRWVFVGAPITPDGLNNGKANFPEYHHVYIQEKNGSSPESVISFRPVVAVWHNSDRWPQ